MKLLHCHIRQFGFLKEKDFDFEEGIHLITGPNESGKSTMHTALAALLFGMARGRGRAAASGTWQNYLPWNEPECYGGSLSFSREEAEVNVERNFAAVPPTAYITCREGGTERELTSEELPLPAGLTPYIFYNTLSFRQSGASVTGDLSGELKSRILNLEGSGSETVDFGKALQHLKNERKALEKQLNAEAAARSAECEEALQQLEAATPNDNRQDLEDIRAQKKLREDRLEELSSLRSELSSSLEKRRSLMETMPVNDPEEIKRDRVRLQEANDNLVLYRKFYADKQTLSPRAFHFLGIFCPVLTILLFLTIVFFLRRASFPAAACIFFLSFLPAALSVRLSRQAEAAEANAHNEKLVRSLYARYLPDTEAAGSLSDAEGLMAFLDRLSELIHFTGEQEKELAACTEELIRLSARRDSFEADLEEQLRSRLKREEWELSVRRLQDELEELEPVLAENKRINAELEAIDLAASAIETLAKGASGSFGVPLTRTASGIFREITGGAYDGLRVHEELELEAIQKLRAVPLSSLSGGTSEQLYFAFRIALIKRLWPEEDMPIFLDESFARYDGDRLRNILRWLNTNYKGQVFLFSCQSREEQILREENIPYHKLEL